eukprot:scaffold240737_cov26-Tisochrysis_lutea.AAC.3
MRRAARGGKQLARLKEKGLHEMETGPRSMLLSLSEGQMAPEDGDLTSAMVARGRYGNGA